MVRENLFSVTPDIKSAEERAEEIVDAIQQIQNGSREKAIDTAEELGIIGDDNSRLGVGVTRGQDDKDIQ